ncbi:MAG: preprotein translocase, SecG subunit [Parcubacteria bacterium C7867-005]|nr:MAG: preprotein translocase, SecG subunit [Parcubacteria bacterium C7867-005]
MIKILPYIEIVLSLLLIVGVLLQRSEAGLGSAFGGDSLSGAKYNRRGFEKTLFNLTVLLAVLFAVTAFLNLFLGR